MRGRQLASRREKLKKFIGRQIELVVTNQNWGISEFRLRGELERRDPDQGFFLKRTDVQVLVPYLSVIRDKQDGLYVEMNLSNSRIKSPRRYEEAAEKWD